MKITSLPAELQEAIIDASGAGILSARLVCKTWRALSIFSVSKYIFKRIEQEFIHLNRHTRSYGVEVEKFPSFSGVRQLSDLKKLEVDCESAAIEQYKAMDKRALRRLCIFQRKESRFRNIFALTLAMKDEDMYVKKGKARCLKSVSQRMAEMGRLEHALRVIQSLPKGLEWEQALATVCKQLVLGKNVKEAVELSRNISKDRWKLVVYRSIERNCAIEDLEEPMRTQIIKQASVFFVVGKDMKRAFGMSRHLKKRRQRLVFQCKLLGRFLFGIKPLTSSQSPREVKLGFK